MTILDQITSAYRKRRGLEPKSKSEQRAFNKLSKLAVKTYFDIDSRAQNRRLTHNRKDIKRIKKYEQDRADQYLLTSARHLGRAYSLPGESRVARSLEPNACSKCRRFFRGKTYRLSKLMANGDNIGKSPDQWKPVIGPVHVNCKCGAPMPIMRKSWGIVSLDQAYEEQLIKSRTLGAKDKHPRKKGFNKLYLEMRRFQAMYNGSSTDKQREIARKKLFAAQDKIHDWYHRHSEEKGK